MATEYPVYFKQAWTANTCVIPVNPEITVGQFMEFVYPTLSLQFNIQQEIIELVETGKVSETIIASEAADPLIYSDKKLKYLWGETLREAAFYVRKKNHEYPQLNLLIERRTIQREDECPICYQQTTVTRRYNCIHRVCDNCHNRCLSNNYNICSLCRSG